MKIRVEITKQCKALRDWAVKYQKEVIEYEKWLIAEVEPAEKKLKAMEDEIKEMNEIEKRKKILPDRMSEVSRNWFTADPEEILKMNSDQFNQWIVDQRVAKLFADKEKFEEEKRNFEADKLALEKERQEEAAKKEVEERTRLEEQEKAKKEAELVEQRHKEDIARTQKEAEEKKIKEQQDAERVEREKREAIVKQEEEERKAKEANEKNEKYKTRLAQNNYDKETFKVEKEWEKFIMYKKVSEIVI